MTKVQEFRNVEKQVRELLDELEVKERIESTVNAQLKELSNFYRISKSLVAGEDITATLEEICDSVSCVRGVDGAWIGLVGEEGKTVIPVANRKVPESLLRPCSIEKADSPVTEAINMGKITIIDNCDEPERFNKWCSRASRAGCSSAVVFPLIFGDTITGVLVVLSCHPEYFVPQMLPLFQMYANQTSSAVRMAQQEEHIQLYGNKASFHEKQYRLFLEQLSDGVFILDKNLSCTYCNSSFELVSKKDVEELVGKKITPFFSRRDGAPIRSALKTCLEGANSSFTSVIADGGSTFEVRLNPMRAEDGSVIGILGVARDTSENERAVKLDGTVEELQGEIAQRGWMIDDSPTGVLMIKPDGSIKRLNPAAANLLNSDVKRCVDGPIYSLFPEEQRSALATAVATALHSEESELESAISVDDDERYLALRCRRHRTMNEDLIIMFISDINERSLIHENLKSTTTRLRKSGKELEQTFIRLRRIEHELMCSGEEVGKLGEEIKSLKEALVQSGDGLIIANTESGKIIEANKPAMKLFDYSAQEFSTMTLEDILTQKDGREDAARKILNGTYCPYECSMLRRKDGGSFTGSVTSSSFQTPECKLLVIIIRDASRLKKIKNQFEFIVNQLEIVEEMFIDDRDYKDAAEYVSTLVQSITPKFYSLGLQSLRIILDGKTYCIEENSSPGMSYSSEIAFRDMPTGTVDVTVCGEGTEDAEEGILPKVIQRSIDLFAHAIGWMTERTTMRHTMDRNHRHMLSLKKVVKKQKDMNDPLQAAQSSACLLLEKSGRLDSTDRTRLNVIDKQVSEIKRVIKEISSISDTMAEDCK